MDAESREIVKSLAEVAWADGKVTPEERALLLKVLIEAGADPDDVETIDDLLAAPSANILGEPARLQEMDLDEESKQNVLRALLIMSFMDGALSFAEFSQIERTATDFGIDSETLETLRSEALAAAESLKKS